MFTDARLACLGNKAQFPRKCNVASILRNICSPTFIPAPPIMPCSSSKDCGTVQHEIYDAGTKQLWGQVTLVATRQVHLGQPACWKMWLQGMALPCSDNAAGLRPLGKGFLLLQRLPAAGVNRKVSACLGTRLGHFLREEELCTSRQPLRRNLKF